MDREMKIIPYVKRGDDWTLPDNIIGFIWAQMVTDKTVKVVFNEGEVATFEEFKSFMRSPSNTMFTIWTDKPAGIAWLNAINRGAYWANFCVLSFAWGGTAVKLGRKMLDYWYGLKMDSGEPLVKSLAGITPENNKPAVRFIEKIGGEIIGIVPGIIYDAYKNKQVGGVISHIGR